MKKTILFSLGILICNSLYGQSTTEYLSKILNKLKEVKTVSYNSKSSSSTIGDMLALHTSENHINMYSNPTDTFLGASFLMSSIKDSNEYKLCYDGDYTARFDWNNKKVQIDTLNNNQRPRPVAPFFIRAKSLVNYASQNIDSTIIKYNNFQDSSIISFSFQDKIAEFFHLTPTIRKSMDKVSQYELFVDSNHLPYKLIRKMPHQTSWETCSEIKFSNELNYKFDAIKQIPINFTIQGENHRAVSPTILEGEIALDWKLKEIHGDSISLGNLKSKVIMIQFSGIGCGPCEASIPFLKQLVIDNKDNDFEHIYIETWSKNISGIERYKDKKELNFKVLVSNKKTNMDYKIQGVPVFLILDGKRVIKKVIVGYKKGDTDKDIISTINKLLQK